jgi:hypothetical protein
MNSYKLTFARSKFAKAMLKGNNWIESFLSGRSQALIAEGEKSTNLSVDSVVPQGSVLGAMVDFIERLGKVHNKIISLFTIIQISSHVVNELL